MIKIQCLNSLESYFYIEKKTESVFYTSKFNMGLLWMKFYTLSKNKFKRL